MVFNLVLNSGKYTNKPVALRALFCVMFRALAVLNPVYSKLLLVSFCLSLVILMFLFTVCSGNRFVQSRSIRIRVDVGGCFTYLV